MKRIKMVGVCLGAVFVMSATVASVASALPEFGRCLYVVAGGNHKDAGCVTAGGGVKPYVWNKAIIKNKFTTAGGVMTLETPGYFGVECASQTGTGEFKAAATIKEVRNVVFKYQGCKIGGGSYPLSKCENAGPEEIVTKNLKGPIGFINKAKKEVGLKLAAEKAGTPVAEFTCVGFGPFTFKITLGKPKSKTNAFIGVIVPVNTMTLGFTLTEAESGGLQVPQTFENPVLNVNLEKSVNPGEPFRQTGLSETIGITPEEEVEIKAEV